MDKKPRLWITYTWDDNEKGNFSYLVQQLNEVGIESVYDRVSLIPGRIIWDQISNRIIESSLDGWGYLLTPKSIANPRCREELAYALNRALYNRGQDFPLIGMLHDVEVKDIPDPLKIRLCVNLADPN